MGFFQEMPVVGQMVQMYEDSDPDPRTSHWLLLWDNPAYVWALTAAYLLFVWLGPKAMQNRKPYSLTSFMVIYNLGLVALSVYMFVEIVLSAIELKYDFICAKYNAETRKDPREIRMATVLWWYFFSKAIELLDTVCMILRKKEAQVTFLHVYHHASMLNIWWWVMTYIPGGCAYFGSGLNCLVHVVMYLYYGLSALPALRGKLWWKKYITKFQLLQFCCTLTHSIVTLYLGCDFPNWGKWLLVSYMVSMLILFSNFYIHAYMKRHQRQHKPQEKGTPADAPNGVFCDAKSHHHKLYTNGHIDPKKSA